MSDQPAPEVVDPPENDEPLPEPEPEPEVPLQPGDPGWTEPPGDQPADPEPEPA